MVQAIFELVLNDKLEMIVSLALKNELSKKLNYYGATKQLYERVMRFVDKKGITVEPTVKIEKSRDSKDNFLLELAETTQANYVITRDKDLLVLENWKDTIIIKPEDFLPLLRKLTFGFKLNF